MDRIERIRVVGVALVFVVAPVIMFLAVETGIMIQQGSAARWAIVVVAAILALGGLVAFIPANNQIGLSRPNLIAFSTLLVLYMTRRIGRSRSTGKPARRSVSAVSR